MLLLIKVPDIYSCSIILPTTALLRPLYNSPEETSRGVGDRGNKDAKAIIFCSTKRMRGPLSNRAGPEVAA